MSGPLRSGAEALGDQVVRLARGVGSSGRCPRRRSRAASRGTGRRGRAGRAARPSERGPRAALHDAAPPEPDAVRGSRSPRAARRTEHLSMLRPAKPSTAGSSVIEASITSADGRPTCPRRGRARSRRPSGTGRASRSRPCSPANKTARPAVSMARDDRVLGLEPLVQALAVAGDDEQRVVDADADADHRRELRREVGGGDDVAEQLDDARDRCRSRRARR